MVNVGLVGVGGYGATILRAAIAAENITIKSLYDANPETAAKAAKACGAQVLASLDEMLEDETISGVALVVPNPLHREMLEACVAAGKHVYVEKPIANTVAEGLSMIETAREAGRILMVGHNTRRAGAFRTAKRMIEAGEIGTLVSLEANFSHSGGLGVRPESWRYRRETCPAVPLIQLGIHCIDTMQYFAGPVKRVSSFMRAAVMSENEDSTVMTLEHESGILATLHSHYVIPGTNFIKLYGTDANLHADWQVLEKTTRQPYETTTVTIPEVDTQAEEMREFGRCIEAGTPPETDGEGAVMALAVVEAALRSADENRIVEIADLMSDARTALAT